MNCKLLFYYILWVGSVVKFQLEKSGQDSPSNFAAEVRGGKVSIKQIALNKSSLLLKI
jgi:hypothetical protein